MKRLLFILLSFMIYHFSPAQKSAEAGDTASQDPIDGSAFIKDNPNVYSLLIARNGKILKETYYNGYADTSLFNDQSLTKGICSLLIGIAIDRHFIRSLDEKLVTFFPELKYDSDRRKRDVTIRQVMNQASGLYHEDRTQMFQWLGNENPSRLVLTAPMVADPGKGWYYNNAASHLLSVILTRATGMDTRTFAARYLFDPMGITLFDWKKMNDGFYDGSGLLSIRLRSADMLKIGQMILQKGKFQNKQIVPAEWIGQIMMPEQKYRATWGFGNSDYALCWYHAVHEGTPFVYAMGWGGQFLVMIPSLQTVIMINQNVADATAIKQSNNFISNIFPLVFSAVKSGAYSHLN